MYRFELLMMSGKPLETGRALTVIKSVIQRCVMLVMLKNTYLSNQQFRTRVKGEVPPLFHVNSGVPQGSVLGPMQYLLFTSDLPQAPNITIGAFADDTVILTCHNDIPRAYSCVQE
jgi:hypothetical protein